MQEIAIFVLLLVGLVALGLARAVPALVLVEDGRDLMLAAAAVGIPLQVVYFGLLGACLAWSQRRPAGWFWRPFEHHHLLTPAQRWLVLPVFYAGAIAFVAIVLGISSVVLGLGALWLGR